MANERVPGCHRAVHVCESSATRGMRRKEPSLLERQKSATRRATKTPSHQALDTVHLVSAQIPKIKLRVSQEAECGCKGVTHDEPHSNNANGAEYAAALAQGPKHNA